MAAPGDASPAPPRERDDEAYRSETPGAHKDDPMVLAQYATVLMVVVMPLAGALYMVTSTAWTALEQALWRRPVAPASR